MAPWLAVVSCGEPDPTVGVAMHVAARRTGARFENVLRETVQGCVPSTPRGWPGWR